MTDTPQDNTPETEAPEPETPAAPEADAKRKFQEALERKARMGRAQQAHQDGRQKIKGLNGPKGQTRNFRRKSG
ncbi:DUF5302 domain-containing protein [Streptomyces sp. NPDC053750]|uniref:DUF5302 domain-containing protein n=1 Tax=Streptomyces sp. NPDC053750 TaxID=3365714 RepID=UPI0037CE91E1